MAYFGEGSGPIHLDNVHCFGTEQRLVGCPANPVGVHNCFHYEDAGVRCQPGEWVMMQCAIAISIITAFFMITCRT